MRVLFSVQRYGADFAGGAEGACRGLAQAMARRGHEVEVVTSAAKDYVTWKDAYPVGTQELNGVLVHRFGVRAERTRDQFDAISSRCFGRPAALPVERDWLRVQGPDLPQLNAFVRAEAARFHVASFYTYLYPTTALALTEAAPRVATVVHPAAHHEPPLELRVFDEPFERVDGIALHTPEEGALVDRRFRHHALTGVIGAGIDLDHAGGDGDRFRRRFGFGAAPLLLFVGRVDVNKGSDELLRYVQHLQRILPELRLAVVGDRVHEVDDRAGVVFTGFVDEATKHDAYAAANVFVMPSYQESFSIALCEAWLHGRPAIVQGNCDVLAGQARRAQAALAYHNYAEFAEATKRLLSTPRLRDWLGENGRRYVIDNYQWSTVAERYEHFLCDVVERRRAAQPRARFR